VKNVSRSLLILDRNLLTQRKVQESLFSGKSVQEPMRTLEAEDHHPDQERSNREAISVFKMLYILEACFREVSNKL
jgi:hypothetical protein